MAEALGVIFLALAAVGIYFLPAIFASYRDHHQANAIAILNLFLGWTFIGWVIALVWSATVVVKSPSTISTVSQPNNERIKSNTSSRLAIGFVIFVLLIIAIFVFARKNSTDSDIQQLSAEGNTFNKRIADVDRLNDKCRGGSGDSPDTIAACEQRDELIGELKRLGWCYGPDYEIEAKKRWLLCKTFN